MVLFFSVVLLPLHGIAQVFRIASGPVSEKVTDSRSVNFVDINNDGWEDLFISNGRKGGQADLLYLNDGTGNFLEITTADMVLACVPSDGAAFADVDNDGFPDGVVSSWYGAEDRLYRNDGYGMLHYQEKAGIVTGSYAETASFGDYDNDGWVDLYITNSGGDKHNYLYHNLGDGRFERITDHLLVEDAKLSRGAIWGDLNGDGLLDLFVANEENAANDIFLGKGKGRFERLDHDSIALKPAGSMTASLGDIDNDGDMDVFVGNSGYFSPQKNQLYRNTGRGFEEITEGPVVETANCTYGSAFGDYDNDGDLDLIVTNGYCNTGLPNALYENQGDGTFRDVSEWLPANGNICTYGVAWGDVNNDGFPDLVVANCKNNAEDTERANTLLINEGNDNHWLQVQLKGVRSNASAIGARVKVSARLAGKPVRQLREVQSQSGYAGQNSLRLQFGLADATVVDSLQIYWPAGGVQTFTELAVDQFLVIKEDSARPIVQLPTSTALSFRVLPESLVVGTTDLQLEIDNRLGQKKGTVTCYNAVGQMVGEWPLDYSPGLSQVKLPVAGVSLSAGMYRVVMQVEDQRINRNIIIN